VRRVNQVATPCCSVRRAVAVPAWKVLVLPRNETDAFYVFETHGSMPGRSTLASSRVIDSANFSRDWSLKRSEETRG